MRTTLEILAALLFLLLGVLAAYYVWLDLAAALAAAVPDQEGALGRFMFEADLVVKRLISMPLAGLALALLAGGLLQGLLILRARRERRQAHQALASGYLDGFLGDLIEYCRARHPARGFRIFLVKPAFETVRAPDTVLSEVRARLQERGYELLSVEHDRRFARNALVLSKEDGPQGVEVFLDVPATLRILRFQVERELPARKGDPAERRARREAARFARGREVFFREIKRLVPPIDRRSIVVIEGDWDALAKRVDAEVTRLAAS